MVFCCSAKDVSDKNTRMPNDHNESIESISLASQEICLKPHRRRSICLKITCMMAKGRLVLTRRFESLRQAVK